MTKFNPKTFQKLDKINLNYAEMYASYFSIIESIEKRIQSIKYACNNDFYPTHIEIFEVEKLQHLFKTLMYFKEFVEEIDKAVIENRSEIELSCIFDYA